LTEATINLLQMVGRLIRTTDDRGVVAILDSRLHDTPHGRRIRDTLPPFTLTTDDQEAAAFLAAIPLAEGE